MSVEISTKLNPKLSLTPPSLFNVIYVNDNSTTAEFVVTSLKTFFGYDTETSVAITYDVHNKGSAVVAVLPYEIAEQKNAEVTAAARKEGFPLQVRIEKEES